MSGKFRLHVVAIVWVAFVGLMGRVAPVQAETFPASWFYPVDASARAKLDRIVGKPMPELKLSGWVNGKAARSIKGKILLVDFWATWCGPCIRNIPHTNEIMEKYSEHGVVVLGVCTSSGQENFAKVVKDHSIAYPAAKDANSTSARAWGVQFYPTYALVGRDGLVLATGLTANGAENAIQKLLTDEGVEIATAQPIGAAGKGAGGADAAGGAADDFPANWFYPLDPQRKAALNAVVGKPLPALNMTDWLGGKKPETEGKITVIDIWATWCGPCISAIPHTNELAAKYADEGVVVVGVCSSSRGQEVMEGVAKKYDMKYFTGKDPGSAFASKMGLQFYPTYAVTDRKGIVRAIGLAPQAVELVVKRLLKEQPADGVASESAADSDSAPTGSAKINPAWLEGDAGLRARLSGLEGKAPPAMKLGNWINAESMTLDDLKGKVVLLDFWATWCGPCLSAVPHTNGLMKKYADQGLRIIGVCNTRGAETMAATVKKYKIEYPVAADYQNGAVETYRVNGFPDYYLIDRFGKLRIADCANGSIEDAIKALLAEQVAAE